MQTEGMREAMDDIRMRAQPKVVIGISAFNIEASVEKIVTSLNAISDEILVCDDASTDSTSKIAQSLNCRVISHPHHLGPGATMRSLFLAANKAGADVLLTVATDMLCNPADLGKLIDSISRHEADIAIGSRFALKPLRSTEGFDRSMLTVYGLPVQDPKSPIRAYSKAAVSAIASQSLEKADILPSAKKLDLGLMEYEVSTKPFSGRSERQHSSGPIDRMVEYTSIKHPLAFYQAASVLALIGAAIVAYLTYEYWLGGFGLSMLGVIVAVTLFLAWIIIGVSGTILYSLSKTRR